MAHVGNRDQQTPALATAHLGRFAIHRIVKVASVFAIDRDQRHIAQIHPILAIFGQDFVGQTLGLVDACRRKLVRHAVLAHRDFNLHAWVVDLAQHFLDTAHRLPKQSGRLGQLDHHHLPRFGRSDGAFGNHHVLPIAFVFRCHQPQTAFVQQAPNDGLLWTFNDLDNAPFGTALAVLADDANLHAVLVQNGTHFIRGQVNV